MLSEDVNPAGPAADVPAAHGEHELAAEGDAAEAARAEDELALASISLPASTIRRIARSAAPGVRFSAEACAGLHRVAQAFICYATDRALAEVKLEVDKGKRPKGKAFVPPPRKTLSCDHVMRFLSRDLPPIGSKVAALFPQLMSSEFKPPGIQLLEQLHEQQRTAAKAAAAADEPHIDSISSTLDGFATAAADGAWAGAAEESADNGCLLAAGKRPNDNTGGPVKASKKMRTGNELADGASAPEAQGKKVAKAKPATASLTRFFGGQSTSAPAAPAADSSNLADTKGKALTTESDGLPEEVQAVPEVKTDSDL